MTHQSLTIVGHLGADPEMDFSPSGQARTRFSVAVNQVYNNREGTQVKETIWFRVTCWARLAETCDRYLHKGSLVLIEGRLQADPATGGPRLWSRSDGLPATSFELAASEVRFLGGRGGMNLNSQPDSGQAPIPA